MTDRTHKPSTHSDYAQRILRVLIHIQHNLDCDLPLEALAKIAHFSPFHFHRVFRGVVGESVMQYVRRLRLERAAARLKHSDEPITTIALGAGYEAHEAFTRAFRQSFDCSPSDFRAAASSRSTQITAPADVHYVAADQAMNFRPLTMEMKTMDVQIREIPKTRTLTLRHVGPYNEVGETWDKLCTWAGMRGLLGPGTRFFGACYDDPEVTPADKIRYDACLSVDDSIEAEGEFAIQTMGGGRWAVVLHEGPYENLNETYAALFGRWFAESKYEPDEYMSLEFYLNDPNNTDPENLLTDVCVRIRDGGDS